MEMLKSQKKILWRYSTLLTLLTDGKSNTSC